MLEETVSYVLLLIPFLSVTIAFSSKIISNFYDSENFIIRLCVF